MAREHAGLRKIQLAKKTGFSLSYVGRLESGKGRPSRAALVSCASATGVDVRWLETGEGEMQPTVGPQDREIADMLEAVQTIIKSNNRLVIQALKTNLEVFLQAVRGRRPRTKT